MLRYIAYTRTDLDILLFCSVAWFGSPFLLQYFAAVESRGPINPRGTVVATATLHYSFLFLSVFSFLVKLSWEQTGPMCVMFDKGQKFGHEFKSWQKLTGIQTIVLKLTDMTPEWLANMSVRCSMQGWEFALWFFVRITHFW